MPQVKIRLKGTTEEKFGIIEKVLHRLMRRSNAKIATAILPPALIFSREYNGETGVFLDAILPKAGRLVTIGIALELAQGVKKTDVSIELYNLPNGIKRTVQENIGSFKLIELNLDINPGNVLTVLVNNPADVVDAKATAVYEMATDDITVKRVLLDEVDKLEELNNEGID